ncbi:MAG: ABC transporter substrate-binding protein [Hyphomicrobium sp.]|jgi:NitT/TauT family transport system substrate-binding protein|nr:ABC transporter substrate-binding protein [Hyphomicrobium sp.]
MIITRRAILASGLGIAAAEGLGRLAGPAAAWAETRKLRVASVKFGTLAWLLETIKAEKLDVKYGIELEIVETATNQSSPVALYGGSADVVVTDWPWALRQRAMGEAVKFAPFSGALGAVIVPADSPVRSLAELKGKKLGVAGSSTDKSWLLLRAHAKQELGADLADLVQPQYGAAPLLAEQLKDGRLDAVLNFWTFTARLEAQGFRRVISISDVMTALGIDPQPALVGFIWKESAEAELLPAINGLLAAAKEANELLAQSDSPWDRLRPMMKAVDDKEFQALKAGYRAGIRGYWSEADMKSAEKIMNILLVSGDAELAGKGTRFDPKAFYAPGA